MANSITQPAAILAAPEVCISFQVVSESMPMPPQGSITKLFMGRSAVKQIVSKVKYKNVLENLTEASRVNFVTIVWTRAKEKCVRLTVTRLNFLEGRLPRSKSLLRVNRLD